MTRKNRTVAAALLMMFMCEPSYGAGFPVFDEAAFMQLVFQVENGVRMLEQAVQTVAQLKQTVSWLTNIFDSFSKLTDINQIAGLLRIIQNPLPMEVAALESLMRGVGGAGGFGGTFGGMFNANLAANTLFHATTETYGTISLQERLNAISAWQGMGDTMLKNSQDRMDPTRELIDRLNTAKDPADKMDITARLTGEQNMGTLQTNQAISAGLMGQAAMHAADIRAEQRVMQADQTWLEEAKAQTGTW